MLVINVEKLICIEEVFKGIQNLNVELLLNLAVAFADGGFLKGLILADMWLIYIEMPLKS